MNTKRIAAVVLTIAMALLIGWSIFAKVGDVRTHIILGGGVILGIYYAVIGRVPDWIIDYSGGAITQDDDPSNISHRIYVPVLLGVIFIAVTAIIVVAVAF